MNQIEFKKYTYFPNIQKMDADREKGLDNYDYIAFCFELAMTKENKRTNAYFAGYLFLDFHEKYRNVSFDIPNIENDSNNCFLYRIDNKKDKIKKEIGFENGREIVSMKLEPTSTTYDPSKSYSELTQQFIDKDMKDKFAEAIKFLDIHTISYEKEKIDTYRKEFLQGAKKFFADKILKEHSIISTYSEVSSLILYEKMNASLSESPVKKAHKI